MYYYIFGALLGGIALWAIGSYLAVRTIEEPAYTVLEKKDGYEIREYKPYIVAETTVTGSYSEATTQGFRIIADYIFGNNIKKESIAMTVPVLEANRERISEKISMTVPVLASSIANGSRVISFVLPSKYTLDTLPKPNNDAVVLKSVQRRKVAALTFTWYPTETRVETKKKALVAALQRDKQKVIGKIETARYNPPFSMPVILRNEILVQVE